MMKDIIDVVKRDGITHSSSRFRVYQTFTGIIIKIILR